MREGIFIGGDVRVFLHKCPTRYIESTLDVNELILHVRKPIMGGL